jgi:lysophospholipase L1-like esterase
MRRPVVLVAGLGVLAGLVVAEIGARLWFDDGVPLRIHRGSSDGEIEARAHNASQTPYGPFTYDENGFRIGSGLPYDRTILFIGDSFTEGFGVGDDDTFARATERALRRDGLNVRSLNAGNRGFGAAQELKVLRRQVARMRIDAVVMQSFPMNDLSDNLAYGGFGIENARLIEYETPRPPWRAWWAGLIGGSWAQNLYIVRLAANPLFAGYGPAPFDSPDSFDLEVALVSEIISTARAHNLPIVVLVIPTKLVQRVQRVRQVLGPAEASEVQRFERVRALVRDTGVPFVDAGEIITDLAADAAKADGSHFSREGNALIGEAIARKLGPLLSGTAIESH